MRAVLQSRTAGFTHLEQEHENREDVGEDGENESAENRLPHRLFLVGTACDRALLAGSRAEFTHRAARAVPRLASKGEVCGCRTHLAELTLHLPPPNV